jgi:hypothetical protein
LSTGRNLEHFLAHAVNVGKRVISLRRSYHEAVEKQQFLVIIFPGPFGGLFA